MRRERENDEDPDNHQVSPHRRRLNEEHDDGQEQGTQEYGRGRRDRRATFALNSQFNNDMPPDGDQPRRGRGRPRGSTNAARPAPAQPGRAPHRPRGRPSSDNRQTVGKPIGCGKMHAGSAFTKKKPHARLNEPALPLRPNEPAHHLKTHPHPPNTSPGSPPNAISRAHALTDFRKP